MSYYVTCPLGTKAERFLPKGSAMQNAQRWDNQQDAIDNAQYAPFNTAVQCAVLAYMKEDINSPNVAYPSQLWLVQADYEKNWVSVRPIPSNLYYESPQKYSVIRHPVEPSIIQDLRYRVVAQQIDAGSMPFSTQEILQKLHTDAQSHLPETKLSVFRPGESLLQQVQTRMSNATSDQCHIGIVYQYILPHGIEQQDKLSQAEMDAFCSGALAVTTRGGHIRITEIESSARTCFAPKFDCSRAEKQYSELLPDFSDRMIRQTMGQDIAYAYHVLNEVSSALNDVAIHTPREGFISMWEMAMKTPEFSQEHQQALLQVILQTKQQGGNIHQAACNVMEANKHLLVNAFKHDTVMPNTIASMAQTIYKHDHNVQPDTQLVDNALKAGKEIEDIEWDEK